LPAEKTTREQLVEALAPLLPKSWKVVPFSRNLDTIAAPTVMVHASRIEKMPEAPGARHTVTFTVSVFDPHDDPSRAQGALDDEVIALIFALDTIRYVKWTSAEASQLGQDGPLGWDITLELSTKKEATRA
jgi:hypothetical protein